MHTDFLSLFSLLSLARGWVPALSVTGLLVFGLVACERPFIEETGPEFIVLEPNIEAVLVEREVRVRIEVENPQETDSVHLNGLAMDVESKPGIYGMTVRLNRGVNNLLIEAFGRNNTVRFDSLQPIFVPGYTDAAPLRLPEPRGGHTTTVLLGGDLLIAGGASLPTASAYNDALRFSRVSLSDRPRRITTLLPRLEHTATRLPNGRVLFIGGSTVSEPTLVEQLVETVEIYFPNNDSTAIVPVGGDPIRRSGHTAILFPVRDNGTILLYIYLYGGFGDTRYRPASKMGIRSDIRVFRFRNDSLVAAGPTIGPFIDAIADHTVTPIQPVIGSEAEFLFGGSFFASEDLFDTVVFESSFRVGQGIFNETIDPMSTARSGHAAERLVDGEILIFGGRTFGPTTAKASVEAYFSRVKRFYPFPSDLLMLQPRWGHTATNWDHDRILIVGGFGHAGAGLTTSEWFGVGKPK